jgi:hypothetical protein
MTMVNSTEYNDFVKAFQNVVFRITEWDHPKKSAVVEISLVLPVTINVRPDDQTATVQVDRALLNKLIQKTKKRNATNTASPA